MATLPDFESIKQTNILGQEYWSARDLMVALGYDNWQNFEKVISKAMTALISPEIGLPIENHFIGTNKMVRIGSGAKRQIKDYFLSRNSQEIKE